MSSWNKNNPRFRRTRSKNAARKPKPLRGRSRKNLLSRFGTRIGGLLRGLTGKTVPQEKTPPNRPQPAPPEDPFEDLKIAVPKNRKYAKACATRSRPRPEAEAEAGRQKAVAAVMEAITVSPDPEDLAAECEDMVDPRELVETAGEPEASPAEPEAPAEAVAASVPAPVPDDAEPARTSAAETAGQAEPPEAKVTAEEPQTPPAPPEPGQLMDRPKIAVLEQKAKKASGSRRRPPDRAARAIPSADEDEAAVRRERKNSRTAAGKTASAEKAITAEDDAPAASAKALSETDHIKNAGKKPTDWSRLAGSSRPEAPRRSRRVFGLIIILVLVIAGLGLAFTHFPGQKSPVAKIARIPAANLPKIEPLAPGFYELWAREREAAVRSEVTITAGSSLGKALEAVGVGTRHGAPAIIESLTGEGGLGVVRPGAVVKSYWADRGRTELDRLEYHPASGDAPLVVRPKADGGFMRYSLATLPLTVSMFREGAITSSLWEAGAKAGLDSSVIMNITEILASEVDFFTEIKTGDTFQVLYNRDYSDGRPKGVPVIEMVKLVNKGRNLEYYRFIHEDGRVGYYDPEGRSSIKTFFATPLQYKRISSHFSLARKHPITKKVRAHQGVDYAAPSGTPVSAVADGTVVFCGWSGGYGKLVTIKHDETYTTMYAHLSEWAPGLKKGSVVKQGDLIGKVGSTGLSTGPHLDFRLKKNNVFIDPLPELAKQQGKKIESKVELQAFSTRVGQVREQIRQQMATNSASGE